MVSHFSQLFLCCIAWMYVALVLFSLACLSCFDEKLAVNQILDYYGLSMISGIFFGILWNYVANRFRTKSS